MIKDGIIRVDTSVTPNKGVSIADVQTVLKVSDTDLGTLCIHNKVNMWARYKPLKVSTLEELTPAQMQSVFYGIYRKTGEPLLSPTTFKLNNNPWQYQKPTGTLQSPYRLTDFKNYYHNAPCPIRIQFPFDELPINNDPTQAGHSNFIVSFEKDIPGWLSDTCMYMTDIFEDSSSWDYYLTVGLIHYRENNLYACYFQSTEYDLQHYFDTPGYYAVNILVDLADFRTKMSTYATNNSKWQAIVFLSNEKCSGKTDIPSSTMFLQYDSTVPVADSEGYQNGCDRHIMTVKTTDWSEILGTLTLTTTYKKDGSYYKVDQAELTVERLGATTPINMGISFEATGNVNIIYSGTVVPSHNKEFTPSTVTQINLAANELEKTVTFDATNFSNLRYDITGVSGEQAAVLNCLLHREGGSTVGIGTETRINRWEDPTQDTVENSVRLNY